MNAVKMCESYLAEDRAYNAEKKILGSHNSVIDRLLTRQTELAPFYDEITRDLTDRGWKRVLAAVIYTTAGWNPEEAKKARDAQRRLRELNSEIETLADKLAAHIDTRTNLCEYSGYATGYEYHIVRLIHESDKESRHYDLHIRGQLEQMRGEYDLKYWPTVAQVLRAIARDSSSLDVYASDVLTAAGTASGRPSQLDFLRALFAALREESKGYESEIPESFKLSDSSCAAVINAALALSATGLVGATYVKRFRQRERESGR